ncbi:SusC/RagA family TonB-linked outer membrane protein [Aquimarina sp. 2201CG5-10]|uniref:SusC/RagA family TonB-linked outer membrane protein n=1 Tax=Aquimarina callyspongiae TaxID=3098150 RepID=UPI002AB593EA|nr:SusC/RagA family TonB-linked outer membrane protein [Aquimarina sp. 2201CG5-10]MDY8134142.1 SusC/RagA family TonB-linked outer membrane protein [Aquimarina sp. 2201CG5-10]
MRTKIVNLSVLLLMLVTHFSYAQERTISGNVSAALDNMPLPGVNVVIKNTTNGVQTDFDGNYTIKASKGQIIVFSFLGMQDTEVIIGDNTTINVALEEDVAALEEVVIEGYRTRPKTKSVISAVTVSAESLENRPNASTIQSLSGQVAGLDISTASGQPGANSLVQIRGVSSINGNTEPLFLMDGIPINEDNFRSLNPNDIASISVIKDAAGTAIFGSRGANGVIVIKTKRGSKGSGLKVKYTGTQSFATLQGQDYNLLSTPEYLRLERERGVGRGGTGGANGGPLTDAEIAAQPETDWLDFFLRTARTVSHNVSFTQGGENTSSFTSLGYFDQEGILRNTGLKRFNLRNNINGTSQNGKFNYASSFTANYSKSDLAGDVGSTAVNRNPFYGANSSLPYFTPEDYPGGAVLAQDFQLAFTPLYIIDRLRTYDLLEEEVKIIAGFSADYEILENLTAKINVGGDYESITFFQSEGPDSRNSLRFAQNGNTTPGFQDQQSTRNFSFNSTTSLNYNKVFGRHTVDASAYIDYFKAHFRTFGFRANGLNPRTFFPGDGSGFVDDNGDNDFFVDQANSNRLDAGLFSYFGNVDYDYDSKFGVSATVRRDASYRFATTNRWGTFYSVGARWNISNENFMGDSVINDLKLRVSYGTTGNQRITGNTYFSGADLPFSFFGTGQGYGGANAIFSNQIGVNTLKWEEVTQTNIGVDFGVFNSRLRGSIDVYRKKTDDLFQSLPISLINGQGAVNANVGELTNTGVDWTLAYDLVKNQDLRVTLNFVGNYNENELANLPSETGEILGIGRNGGRINEVKTVRYAGVNPANGNLLFLDVNGNLTENPDFDRDAVWTGKNNTPDASGNFGFDISYKGFYLTTQWNYVIGVDRFDFDYAGFIDRDLIGDFQLSGDILNAWTPDNRITDVPSLDATNLDFASDRFLRSSDYLRLRFLNVGYVFPKKFLKGTGIDNLKIFGTGENLFTFSEWRGYDAEARLGTRTYPTPRILSFGIELGL